MKRLAATAIVLLFAGSGSPSAKPAFDCSKAKTAAVKTICANDDLGRLDVLVNQAYAPAISQENTRNKAVTLDKAFLARVIACGAQHECIRAEQVNFISEMIALVSQPSGDLQQLPLEEPAEDGAPSAPRVEGTQQAAAAPIVAAVQEPAPVVTPQPATDVSPSTHPAPISPTDAECDRTCAANQVTLAQQEFDRTNALVARGFATQELLDQRRQALNAAIAALNTPPPPAPIAHPAPTGSAVYAPAPAAPEYAPAVRYVPLVGDDSYADMEVTQIRASLTSQMKYPATLQVVDMHLLTAQDIVGNFSGHIICGKYIVLNVDGQSMSAPTWFYTAAGSYHWDRAALGDIAAKMCMDAGFAGF
jgi:uncharacterized protein